jgi:hypothetical protein
VRTGRELSHMRSTLALSADSGQSS